MKTLWDLAAFLLPIVFVLLCARIILACIGQMLIPLAILAFVAFVAWIWTTRNR